MKRISIIAICLAAICVAATPASTQPTLGQIRQDRADKIEAAQKLLDKAISEADQQSIVSLDALIKLAMSRGPDGLDEAVQIKSERALVEADIEKHTPIDKPKSIVFLFDGNGNLVGGRDEVMRVYLKGALSSLSRDQSFDFILAQESSTRLKYVYALFSGVQTAVEANKDRATKYVDNELTFHGPKNPGPAFDQAFSEHPKVIFYLTDGEYDANEKAAILSRLNQLNKNRAIAINVLLVKGPKGPNPSREAEDFSKSLAAQNGGTFSILN